MSEKSDRLREHAQQLLTVARTVQLSADSKRLRQLAADSLAEAEKLDDADAPAQQQQQPQSAKKSEEDTP